jgi:predicted permease
LLARTSARRKEIAVRISMGATRARLVRQLLVESVLLALGGGSAGVLLAWWTCDALKSTTPATGIFSFTLDYGLDVPVLGFTLALSVATGIVFGVAPALQASRPDILAALKGEAVVPLHNKRRFKMRDLLVVAQMALSLVLLVDAGLFLRSSNYAQNIDPGFDADKILIARLNINLLRYTKAQGAEFYRQAVERISALPGVEAVSLARVVPISGGLRTSNVFLEGQSETSGASGNAGSGADLQTSQVVGVNVVSVKYFQTMGIKILRGRDFTTEDREGTPGVTIVNESFARRYFAAQEVLGKRVSFRGIAGPWTEIIGIVRDSKYRMLSETPRPYVYQPLAQNHETGMALHARAEGDPKLLVSLVRGELQALDRNLPLTDLQPLTELLNSALFPARMGAALLTVFGALALLLASIGLFGVVSYAVLRRSREIGIRMALGAQRKDVLGMVLREGMTLVGIGTLIGWVTAAALSRLLAGFLRGISAMDPKTFAGIPLLLAAVAALANYLPARRAANVDPMVALRYE